MIEIKLSYDPDPERAKENTRFWAPLALTADQKARLEDPIEMGRRATRCRSSRSPAAGSSPPTPTTALAQLSPTSISASRTSSSTRPGEDQRRFLDAFEEQLMPAVRELSAAG